MIRYNQKRKKQKYIKVIFFSSYILFFIGIIIFHDMGYLKLLKLKHNNNILESKIEEKIKKLNNLEEQKKRLELDMDYIETIARKEFKMAKRGEKVFTILKNKPKKGKN